MTQFQYNSMSAVQFLFDLLIQGHYCYASDVGEAHSDLAAKLLRFGLLMRDQKLGYTVGHPPSGVLASSLYRRLERKAT